MFSPCRDGELRILRRKVRLDVNFCMRQDPTMPLLHVSPGSAILIRSEFESLKGCNHDTQDMSFKEFYNCIINSLKISHAHQLFARGGGRRFFPTPHAYWWRRLVALNAREESPAPGRFSAR